MNFFLSFKVVHIKVEFEILLEKAIFKKEHVSLRKQKRTTVSKQKHWTIYERNLFMNDFENMGFYFFSFYAKRKRLEQLLDD